jgi:transposase
MAAVSGIDWAAEHHDVRIADERTGAVLAERRFDHDEAGIGALIDLLIEQRVVRVAIERPDGLLVGRLLAAGITVMAIHPNQVAAARDRFRAAAGKDDRFDAMVLCELCRTDSHRFPALALSGDETLALRALVRTREDLVAARVGLANQLRAHLDASWPGAARIFADIDSPIALCFLGRYPSPTDARGLGPKRLAAFLARHAYCGRKTPEALLARLRSAPIAAIGELETEARRTAVLGLVAALHPLVEQISRLTSEIRGAIHAHPDGPIFLSFFRDPKSVICAAGLLCEIGDNRARYPRDETLAADGGQAPVTKQSGKHRAVSFRWACDKRLRNHLAVLADSTRHWHPWAHDTYQRAIDRGADHPHALRILGRAWTRVLWRCWQDRVPYDPTQHRALTRHLAQQG